VLAATLGGGVGLVLGALAVVAASLSERSQRTVPPTTEPPLPRGIGDVLSVLRSIGIVLDASDAVVSTSSSAVAYGLVRHGELVHKELRHLARQVRRDGIIREAELELTKGPTGAGSTVMRARVAPLGSAHVLVLAEDHTHARRVEEIRRDFIANVSHELKTPVGGISLLSEAILDARDDPEAVARFGERIRVESSRLSRLVKEIVDLSRLQVQDTLHEPQLVAIADVISEAVDRVHVSADARSITIDVVTESDLGSTVTGNFSSPPSPISSPTRSTTPTTVPASPWGPGGWGRWWRSRSPTKATAYPWGSRSGSSSGSTGSTRRARGPPAAPVWAWRSSSTSAPTTAAR